MVLLQLEPAISVNVSLLAIILALYATKNDRNVILLFICALFAHVLLAGDGGRTVVDDPDGDPSSLVGAVAGTDVDARADPEAAIEAEIDSSPAASALRTTVSSGVFESQLSRPQTHLTSTVFPATSLEANGKLAAARGSFFNSLVS